MDGKTKKKLEKKLKKTILIDEHGVADLPGNPIKNCLGPFRPEPSPDFVINFLMSHGDIFLGCGFFLLKIWLLIRICG